MAQDAREAVNNGYTDLKLKVGGNAKLDFERVKAIREAVGDKYNHSLRCQPRLETQRSCALNPPIRR